MLHWTWLIFSMSHGCMLWSLMRNFDLEPSSSPEILRYFAEGSRGPHWWKRTDYMCLSVFISESRSLCRQPSKPALIKAHQSVSGLWVGRRCVAPQPAVLKRKRRVHRKGHKKSKQWRVLTKRDEQEMVRNCRNATGNIRTQLKRVSFPLCGV